MDDTTKPDRNFIEMSQKGGEKEEKKSPPQEQILSVPQNDPSSSQVLSSRNDDSGSSSEQELADEQEAMLEVEKATEAKLGDEEVMKRGYLATAAVAGVAENMREKAKKEKRKSEGQEVGSSTETLNQQSGVTKTETEGEGESKAEGGDSFGKLRMTESGTPGGGEQDESTRNLQKIQQIRAQREAEAKKKKEQQKKKKSEGMFDFLLKWHAYPVYLAKKGFQNFKII